MAAVSATRGAAVVLSLTSLSLVIDFISCGTPLVRGAVNGSVTLSPLSSVNFTEILWKKGRDKAVQWEEVNVMRIYPHFSGRVHLDTKSGNLTIFNLTSADEDEYEIESFNLKESSKFMLQVLEPLPPPILNCTPTDENFAFHCWIPENYSNHVSLIRYSWSCRSEQCNNSSEPVMHFKKDDFPQEVQCIISNPLFKRTSNSKSVVGTCIPDGGRHLRHRYTLLALPILLVLWPVVQGVARCCRKKDRPTCT